MSVEGQSELRRERVRSPHERSASVRSERVRSAHERSAHERSAHERSAHERSAHERSAHERSASVRSASARSAYERSARASLAPLALCVASLVLGLAHRAHAQDRDGDGAYERWDSYVTLELTAGALASTRDGQWRVGPVAELRTRILDAAGPFVAFQWDALGEGTLVAGIELRPLWPALFLLDASIGHEWLDLFVQSISVELGAAFLPLGADDPGIAFAWGTAIDLPILLPSRAPAPLNGVGLRVQLRRVRVDERALEAPEAADLWSIGATLRASFGAGRGRSGGARWR